MRVDDDGALLPLHGHPPRHTREAGTDSPQVNTDFFIQQRKIVLTSEELKILVTKYEGYSVISSKISCLTTNTIHVQRVLSIKYIQNARKIVKDMLWFEKLNFYT